MNLKFLLFSIGLWSFVESQSPSFDQWKKDNPVAYNKAAQYKSASQIQSTYAANVKKIQAHNANTKTPYKMKANAKAAYTEQERMKFKGYKVKAIANKTQADASIMKNKFTSATSRPTSTTRKLPTTPSRRTTTPAKRGRRDVSNNENEHLRVARAPIPDNLDYTPDLQPVKDQQNCGASWAFAANTVIEYHAKKNGTDIILSEQNLIDCDAKSSG
jgi:C1A family cysteine protease